MAAEPYSESLTMRLKFFIEHKTMRGIKSMRVSHWTLNLPNSRLSFGAIVSAELLLSKKK